MGDKTKIGMDVGHADNNPMNNDPKNLRNEVPSDNRREPRLRNELRIHPDKSPEKDIRHQIKYHEKMRDYYSGNARAKREQNKEIKWLKDILKKRGFGEEVELDDAWWKDLWAKISQISHPKGWDNVVKQYVDGMKDPHHREHPSSWALDVARQHRGIDARNLIKYINTLIAKGKLPKELKAEYTLDEAKMSSSQIDKLKKIYEPMRGKRISTSNAEKLGKMMDTIGKDKEALIQIVKADIPFVSTVAVTRLISKHNMKGAEINKLKKEEREDWSFRDFVNQIQERELTDTELKRREEIAKDLSDEDFKKKYGGRWKEVKMGVATKMAKKESLKT